MLGFFSFRARAGPFLSSLLIRSFGSSVWSCEKRSDQYGLPCCIRLNEDDYGSRITQWLNFTFLFMIYVWSVGMLLLVEIVIVLGIHVGFNPVW